MMRLHHRGILHFVSWWSLFFCFHFYVVSSLCNHVTLLYIRQCRANMSAVWAFCLRIVPILTMWTSMAIQPCIWQQIYHPFPLLSSYWSTRPTSMHKIRWFLSTSVHLPSLKLKIRPNFSLYSLYCWCNIWPIGEDTSVCDGFNGKVFAVGKMYCAHEYSRWISRVKGRVSVNEDGH